MASFKEFEERDIIYRTELDNPRNNDDVLAEERDKLTASIGEDRLVYIDGQPVMNPERKPPTLTRQLSEIAVTNLYIDSRHINTQDSESRIITSIATINKYLERFGLKWDITFETIYDKLRKNGQYLGNTLYGIWRLDAGAKLVMLESLGQDKDEEGSETLIIDYSNLKYRLLDCKPSKSADGEFAKELQKWINKKMERCKRIIISIQENDKNNTTFIQFKDELKKIYGTMNVIIIIGSNASSYDDLNIAYIVTNLLPKSTKYIISSDKFRDIHKINPDGTTSPIFVSSGKLIMFPVEFNFCEEGTIEGTIEGTHKRYRSYRSYNGGTNKNKKLLLNKYSKKIKYTRKVKKLHKKVKTSHKKHKTTIKAHRKYSKKYKKHRTYKSKRL
jgi:hypothetical protein